MLNRFWLKYFAGCWLIVNKNEIKDKSIWMQKFYAAKAAIVSTNCKIR